MLTIAVLLGGFAALMVLGLPVAVCLGLSSMIAAQTMPFSNLGAFAHVFYGTASEFTLLAVPLFIFAGYMMEVGGMSERIVHLADTIVGRLRGGPAIATLATGYVFSGMTGSKAADVSAVGSLMIPTMVSVGYQRERAVAIVAATGAMGVLVPPCIPMLIFSQITGVSVSALFAAGFAPAAFIALCLSIYMWWSEGQYRSTGGAFTFGRLMRSFWRSALPVAMPAFIIGSIYTGWATPTETAAFAAAYALIVTGLVYRQLTWEDVKRGVDWTIKLTASVLFVYISASLFSWMLVTNRVPELLQESIAAMDLGKPAFFALTILVFAVVGSLMEGLPALIVLTPILFPIAVALDVNPLHYGIVSIASMAVGLIIPPAGLDFLIACNVGRAQVHRVAGPVLPYVAIMAVSVGLLSAVPAISTFLPQMLGIRS